VGVLDDLAGCVELPEVAIVGERVAIAPDRSLEPDKHEDLVTALEDRVRLKTGDLEWCRGLEKPHDVGLAATCLKPRHARHRKRNRFPIALARSGEIASFSNSRRDAVYRRILAASTPIMERVWSASARTTVGRCPTFEAAASS
jgi:hypothetical protein